VDPAVGRRYVSALDRDHPGKLAQLADTMRANNALGDPTVHAFEVAGAVQLVVSPTTVRYAAVLAQLESMLGGSLDGLAMSEIGVGYGGLAQLVLAAHAPKRYTLVDLPDVECLAANYTAAAAALGAYEVRGPAATLDSAGGAEAHHTDCDVFVSNYAFSELSHPLQLAYFDRIIRYCDKGYVTFNHDVSVANLNSDDFVRLLAGYGRSVATTDLTDFHAVPGFAATTVVLVTW